MSQPLQQGTRRPSVGARRVGYAVAIAINATMMIAANVWPGWWAIPVLTDQTPAALIAVNASIATGIVTNAIYVWHDPRWLRALGDIATTTAGLVAAVQVWRVFPFDFPDETFDWATVVRWVLVIVIVGSVIGLIVNVIALLKVCFNPR